MFCFLSWLVAYAYHRACWVYRRYIEHGRHRAMLVSWMVNALYISPIGQSALMQLDRPSDGTVKRRLRGVEYLRRSESPMAHNDHGVESRLTDCRFRKTKSIMPLLQVLEPAATNTICGTQGIHVVLKGGSKHLYLGNNAVHYFSQSFYTSLVDEWRQKIHSIHSPFVFTTITPAIEEHVVKITKLTDMDQARYYLSGSEAVEVALSDVRISTGKRIIVRFAGAYHGHLSGIRFDGPNMVTLRELDERSLHFIREYHYQIAGVIVNPMQYFVGPNVLSPPGEKLTCGRRVPVRVSKSEYASWLSNLSGTCAYCTSFLTPVALIMDDIYFAFRTPELFSSRYFSTDEHPIRPDMIILGKGVAGGFPLSIICGKNRFMNHYDKRFILKVNQSVGTFSAWEGGIVASNLFLDRIANMRETFARVNAKFERFVHETNCRFAQRAVPLRLFQFGNTFTVDYHCDSLFNSMYVRFLTAEGVFLSNQSTGKFNLSDEWSHDDLSTLTHKMVEAGEKMATYGFFEANRNRLWFIPFAWMFFANFIRLQYEKILLDKHIDVQVSHNHPFNRFAHFWSSVGMLLICYPLVCVGAYAYASGAFLLLHVLRQAGHFFYERQDPDAEQRKFGHKDATKKQCVLVVAASLLAFFNRSQIYLLCDMTSDNVAMCFLLLTVLPHHAEICHKYGVMRGFHWILKILTDPVTDIFDFYPFAFISPMMMLDVSFLPKRHVA